MKRKTFALWIFLLAGAVSSPVFALDLSTVQSAIQQSGARWEAGVPDTSNPMRMGILPREKKPLGHSLQEMRVSSVGSVGSIPSHFDWRNVNGKNYVTPVRDQGACGSCWAFSVVGALESLALIAMDTPGVDLDLSEQALVSCSIAGSCGGGWPYQAAQYIRKSGIPEEGCYPYKAHNVECGWICSDSLGFHSAYNVKNWVYVSNGTAPDRDLLKSMLVTLGPLSVVFEVYDDFNYYKSGIYSYTSGPIRGEHAVLLVGYDDREGYFIVKNSWGPNWGEEGYFRIAYSQVNNVVKFANDTVGLMGLAAPENRMVLGITANGKRNIAVKTEDPLAIAVSLDPVNQPQANPVDWWIWRTGPDGTYSYDVATKLWKEGLHPIKLPVFRLEPYTIWNGTLSMAGEYEFHFAVDDNDDGIFDGVWQGDLSVSVYQPTDADK